jgi:hypothetical protein
VRDLLWARESAAAAGVQAAPSPNVGGVLEGTICSGPTNVDLAYHNARRDIHDAPQPREREADPKIRGAAPPIQLRMAYRRCSSSPGGNPPRQIQFRTSASPPELAHSRPRRQALWVTDATRRAPRSASHASNHVSRADLDRRGA